MSSKNSQEHQIERSAHLILSIDLEEYKVKNLVKSIAYLLADKFLEDKDKKKAICDALGGKMNAVYNYGKRQKDEGRKEGRKEGIAEYMIKEGKTDKEIQKETELTLEEIQKLRNKN